MQHNSSFATKIMLNRQNNVANVSFYLKKKEKTSFGEMRTKLFGMIPLRSFLQKRQSETVNRQNNVANDNLSCFLSLECDIYTDISLRKCGCGRLQINCHLQIRSCPTYCFFSIFLFVFFLPLFVFLFLLRGSEEKPI